MTGANGFIGTYLKKHLTKKKHAVVTLNSNLLNYENLSNEIKDLKFDHVVHLAGLSHQTNHSSTDLYQTNTIGSQNLILSIERNFSNKKIFLASTGHVYYPSNIPHSEDSKIQPTSHYAMSKLAMEYICKSSAVKSKIIVLRLFNCTGLKQKDSFFIPKLIKLFKEKKRIISLGNLDVEREFNNVNWLAQVIVSLLENDVPEETFNICSGKLYKLKNILELLQQITKHYPEISVREDLVRENEPMKFSGNPRKLNSFLKLNEIYERPISLKQTLLEMLDI